MSSHKGTKTVDEGKIFRIDYFFTYVLYRLRGHSHVRTNTKDEGKLGCTNIIFI